MHWCFLTGVLFRSEDVARDDDLMVSEIYEIQFQLHTNSMNLSKISLCLVFFFFFFFFFYRLKVDL
jgi:hypothetical protein